MRMIKKQWLYLCCNYLLLRVQMVKIILFLVQRHCFFSLLSLRSRHLEKKAVYWFMVAHGIFKKYWNYNNKSFIKCGEGVDLGALQKNESTLNNSVNWNYGVSNKDHLWRQRRDLLNFLTILAIFLNLIVNSHVNLRIILLVRES